MTWQNEHVIVRVICGALFQQRQAIRNHVETRLHPLKHSRECNNPKLLWNECCCSCRSKWADGQANLRPKVLEHWCLGACKPEDPECPAHHL